MRTLKADDLAVTAGRRSIKLNGFEGQATDAFLSMSKPKEGLCYAGASPTAAHHYLTPVGGVALQRP